VRKPFAQFIAALAGIQTLDAKAKLSQRYGADVKFIERTGRNEGKNLWLRFRAAAFASSAVVCSSDNRVMAVVAVPLIYDRRVLPLLR
jgi:hypothetical protein